MKRTILFLVLAALAAAFAAPAFADEGKFVGVVTKIDIAGADAKTAVATVKDNKTNEEIAITVNDDETLDKFKDHRISAGDEVRVKYTEEGGKKVSTYFRKTAGC
jgi:predicted transcriptional regulator